MDRDAAVLRRHGPGVRTHHRRLQHRRGPERKRPDILGRNPDKATIHRELRTFAAQAIAFDASRFRQFGGLRSLTGTKTLFAPVQARPGAYGIAGIAGASIEQRWNWRSNAADLADRTDHARQQALAYRESVAASVPDGQRRVPEFSALQLDLETWSRLRNGERYHDFNPSHGMWVRRAAATSPDNDAGPAYADRLARLRAAVMAGQPPRGWNDTAGDFSAPPEDTIRDLLSSESLDAAAGNVFALLASLGWWELWRTLEALKGPGLPLVTPLDTLAGLAATSPTVDLRVRAAIDIVLLFQRGRVIGDREVPILARIAEAVVAVPVSDQLMLLDGLGIRGRTAEGTLIYASALAAWDNEEPTSAVAARTEGDGDGEDAAVLAPAEGVSAEAEPAESTAVMAEPAGVVFLPFGDWDKPDWMPGGLYIGLAVHDAIGAFYEAQHSTPLQEEVWTNYFTIGSIINDLVLEWGLGEAGRLQRALANGKPDILEVTGGPHLLETGPLFGYEIKPHGAGALAAFEWAWYASAFLQANAWMLPGPIDLYGTIGRQLAPNGWGDFAATAPGVILYNYSQARRSDIRQRDLARRRQDTTQSRVARALQTLGYNSPYIFYMGEIASQVVVLGGTQLQTAAFAL
jgi:hypothetical protein